MSQEAGEGAVQSPLGPFQQEALLDRCSQPTLHGTETEELLEGVCGSSLVSGREGLSLQEYTLFNQRAAREGQAGRPRNN